MLVSLQGVLEADDLRGELAPAAWEGGFSRLSRDGLSAYPERVVRLPLGAGRALVQRTSSESAASVNRLQTELFSTTMARIAGGYVRECSAVEPDAFLPEAPPWTTLARFPSEESDTTPVPRPVGLMRRLLSAQNLPHLPKPVRKSLRRVSDSVDLWWNPLHLKWSDAKTEWDYSC
jgi:hypothetical protein